jgi:hypothetical protein
MQTRGSEPVTLEDLQATVAALATLTIDMTKVVHAMNPEPVDRLLQASRANLRKLRARSPQRASNMEMEVALRRVELLQLAIRQSAAAKPPQSEVA